ncbi:MAG: hypothetical protein E6H08_12895 [Bacteroidetes bacterium]|nr:MAG: hypothetical protein E6H08_12895 [Bacteroidota bacterium]
MRYVIFLFLFFAFQSAFAQTPSKQDIQNQMKQAIKELNQQITNLEKQIEEAKKNKEDSETIKGLEDQLALLKKQVIMMGGLNKNISNFSDKTIQAAVAQDTTKGVHKIDSLRINALPKEPLIDTKLSVFVQKTFVSIDKMLPTTQKKYAKELYNKINIDKKSSDASGIAAIQCWLAGSSDMAIWILGKACLDDMSNTDNLSNYASMLSMVGGEHLAIPILQNLEVKFPGNTTILNNMGQAWFGLGELTKAKKYLANALLGFGKHPEANETMCKIQQVEGNITEAIESIKRSIREDYTPEKEAKLKELQGKLEYDDIQFRYPAKAEPLGIEKFMFTIPDYPIEGGATSQTSRMEWDDFRQQAGDVLEKLKEEERTKEKELKAYQDLLLANPKILKPYDNAVYKTSYRKLQLLNEWYTDRFGELSKKMDAARDSVEKWREDMNEAYSALGNNADCEAKKSIATNFVSKSNMLWQQHNAELLSLEKQKLNAEATYALYGTQDRSLYEMLIIKIKQAFLNSLGNLHCEFEVGCIPAEIQKHVGKTLPDFDSVNCQYKTELSIKYKKLDFSKYFSIKVECNKMTTSFDVIYVKGSIEENLANGTNKGTVEIVAKIGSDKQNYGPIELGASVSGSVGIQFMNGNIQDVFVSGKVGVKAGVSGDLNLDISPSANLGSLEGRMSIITGQGSITGKGAFSGISIK